MCAFEGQLQCRCLHEIQAVASLPAHPNVIGQYRAWQQSGHFFIQMDLAENGSLGHLLRQVLQPTLGPCIVTSLLPIHFSSFAMLPRTLC